MDGSSMGQSVQPHINYILLLVYALRRSVTRHLLLFSQIPSIDQLEMHFAMDSNLLHKESDEAARQLAKQEGHGEGVRVRM